MSIFSPKINLPEESLSSEVTSEVVPENEANHIPWMNGPHVKPEKFEWDKIKEKVEQKIKEEVGKIQKSREAVPDKILQRVVKEINWERGTLFKSIKEWKDGKLKYKNVFPDEKIRDKFSDAMISAVRAGRKGSYNDDAFYGEIFNILAKQLLTSLKKKLNHPLTKKEGKQLREEDLQKRLVAKLTNQDQRQEGSKTIAEIKEAYQKELGYLKNNENMHAQYDVLRSKGSFLMDPVVLVMFREQKLRLDKEMLSVYQKIKDKSTRKGSELFKEASELRQYYQGQMHRFFFLGVDRSPRLEMEKFQKNALLFTKIFVKKFRVKLRKIAHVPNGEKISLPKGKVPVG